MSDIPILDLADLRSPDPARQTQATSAVRAAFGDYGLVYIRNHGIPAGQLDAFYQQLNGLFARPLEEKARWARPDLWYQRGWTPPNTEKAVIAGGQPDFKECYFVAPLELDRAMEPMFPQIYAENAWPSDAGAFREEYLALGRSVHRIGLEVLQACARSLDLEPDHFGTMTTGGPHVSRALRYLPLDADQVGTEILWGEEHTDFNLLTLLPGGRFFDPEGDPSARPDERAGLYLRARATPKAPQGRLIRGVPPEGCIVAQVGQQLEILTGGTFLATPHIIRPPTAPGFTRTAFAHFVHVHAEQVLFPLAPFRSAKAIRAYGPPRLAGTYGLKTLVDIGLAPTAALEVLGYRQYERLAAQRAT